MKNLLSVLSILLLSAAAADAQTCAGGTELGRGTHRLVAGGAMTDGANGASAGYGFGSDRFFGNTGIGFNRIDGFDATQKAISVLVGSQVLSGERSVLAVCPIGQLDWAFGPNMEPISIQSVSMAGGGRVGFPTGHPENFNVVPTVGVSVIRGAARLSSEALNISQTFWDTYGVANVGVGLRFNRSRMAVVPSVSFPLGLPGADPSFGVTFNSHF